jgi:ATP-dependent Lon protease
MTGELSLTGFVLPVGGVKEKVIAAFESGMEEVIVPKKNAKDLREIPEEVIKRLRIYEVSTLDEALRVALDDHQIDLNSKL